jgi:hypothetical protein
MPDAIELGFFRTAGVVPVLVVSRTAFDDEGPVRLTRYIYAGDQVRIVHDQAAR